MRLAVSFTNFGPYHLARLRALGASMRREGGELLAYEVAGSERKYPWTPECHEEPFQWFTLFPERSLEEISSSECASVMKEVLSQNQPDAVGIVGYVRAESLAALGWARRNGKAAILMSESQEIDRPRRWWIEAIKRRRVQKFDAALVGGPSHREYLVELGLPAERIALGYNAVDNAFFARASQEAVRDPGSRRDLPQRPFFLTVARFVPEKNLPALIRAWAQFRELHRNSPPWDLVVCGSGPQEAEIQSTIRKYGATGSVHCPGFLQADELARWYAHASAFVLPSLREPWGLVANEAAACGLPLLVSELRRLFCDSRARSARDDGNPLQP